MSSEEKNTEKTDESVDKEKKNEIVEGKKELDKLDEKDNELKKIEEKVKMTNPAKEEKELRNENIVENVQKENEENIRQEERKSKNRQMWETIIAITVIVSILLFSTIFALLNLCKNTIAKGVSIRGIDVSNLTTEEAAKKLNEAINVELLLATNLVYGDDYSVSFDVNQIEYAYDVSGAVKNAYKVGRDSNILTNNYMLIATALSGKNIDMDSSYNEESLDGIIDDVASKLPGTVVQASYYIEGAELMIDKGQTGIQLKKDELKKDILENISSRNALKIIENNQPQNIQIQVEKEDPAPIDIDKIYKEVRKDPKDAYYIPEPFQIFREENGVDFAVTMEQAKEIISDTTKQEYTIPLKLTPAAKTIDDIGTEAFPYLISSYTTKYDASNTNRSGNLRIAAGKINGTVLMPGEEFSFNEVVGKRTVQDGYTDAKIYENGKVVDGLAGGICQISSTLYNAVLMANLEVTERRNHSYTSSYVPAGRDATVVYGKQDFKFKNTRKYPIKIEAIVANGIAEFKLHGIKEEVEYEIKIIPVTTQTIPFTTEYVPDPSLAPGAQVVTQAGHGGLKVTTYIERRLAGAVVSKDVLSNDTYNAMSTIVNVGP